MGWIIFLIICCAPAIGFLIGIISVIKERKQISRVKKEKIKEFEQRRNEFKKLLETNEISMDINFSLELNMYFYCDSVVNVNLGKQEYFNFVADLKSKKILIANFEPDTHKTVIIDFSDIKSFEIVDGITDTFSVGNTGMVSGYLGDGLSVASAKTVSESSSLIQKVQLRIDYFDFRPSETVVINNEAIDSNNYAKFKEIVGQIKAFLTKVVDENNKNKVED